MENIVRSWNCSWIRSWWISQISSLIVTKKIAQNGFIKGCLQQKIKQTAEIIIIKCLLWKILYRRQTVPGHGGYHFFPGPQISSLNQQMSIDKNKKGGFAQSICHFHFSTSLFSHGKAQMVSTIDEEKVLSSYASSFHSYPIREAII